MQSPPHYRRYSSRTGQVPQSGAELPPYTRQNTLARTGTPPREPTEHLFASDRGKSSVISLKIYSSAKSPKSLPTFFERESINGRLEINAERGDSIHGVHATVTGRIITGAGSSDSFTFLSITLPIWAKSPDIPRLASVSEGCLGPKLVGHCAWPISIQLPRSVELQGSDGSSQSYRLPETFLERQTPVTVQYDLSVCISRGKLRQDTEIKTAFGYVPNTRPTECSLLRQIAYQQLLPLPGPLADPDGWKVLRSVSARKDVGNRFLDARCTLAVAKPSCYTRGSVIPCFMSVEGSDENALDFFTRPAHILFCLRRRVRYHRNPSLTMRETSWGETVEQMGLAVWWPCPDGQNQGCSRNMQGEIRLAKDLRPTSEMSHFSISYSVALYPFDTEFSSSATPLLSEPVEIATMHSKGPRPHAYSPPAYDAAYCTESFAGGLSSGFLCSWTS